MEATIVFSGVMGVLGLMYGAERFVGGNNGVYAGLVRRPARSSPAPTPLPAPSGDQTPPSDSGSSADSGGPSPAPAPAPTPSPAPQPAVPSWQPVSVASDGTFSIQAGSTYRASADPVGSFVMNMAVKPQLASKGFVNLQVWQPGDAFPSDWPSDDLNPQRTRLQADATQSGSATIPGVRIWRKVS